MVRFYKRGFWKIFSGKLHPVISQKTRDSVRAKRELIQQKYGFDVMGKRKPITQHHTLFGKARWWFRENIKNDITFADIHGTGTTNGKVRELRNIVLWKVATGRNISWGEQPILNDALYELKAPTMPRDSTFNKTEVEAYIKTHGINSNKVLAHIANDLDQDFVIVTCSKKTQRKITTDIKATYKWLTERLRKRKTTIQAICRSTTTFAINLRDNPDERFADFELKWRDRNRNRDTSVPITIILYIGTTGQAAPYFNQLKHKLQIERYKFKVLWMK